MSANTTPPLLALNVPLKATRVSRALVLGPRYTDPPVVGKKLTELIAKRRSSAVLEKVVSVARSGALALIGWDCIVRQGWSRKQNSRARGGGAPGMEGGGAGRTELC